MAVERRIALTIDDGISGLTFGGDNNQLLFSSWDSRLRLFDVQRNQLTADFTFYSPLLCCCKEEEGSAVCGGISKEVLLVDIGAEKSVSLGQHEDCVRCVEYWKEGRLIISGSWDQKIKSWDRRSETRKNVWSVDMKDKVYCMDVRGNACVVGLADGRVLGYDLRNMGTFLYSSISPLKYQTRCIRIFPNCEGFALAGIEGRVAMEYFGQDDEQQSKKYTFKCHREQRGGVDYVYTINTVEFHPIYGTFASGGCDGVVNIWDGEKRKRLTQFPKYETSISSLSFNGDGTLLAIAASYTWESGDEDHPADSIYVRTISDSDVRPKGMAATSAPIPQTQVKIEQT